MTDVKPLGITEVVLRDAHQSLLATRMRIDDMLPIAGKLDQVGFWSLETWGGATFDACIRYLGEDPWERIRELKAAMPNTPQQMLLRGQNLLGYRHYADDVVEKFVERAATNGVDVFRIFDAMNDVRNLQTAIKATLAVDKHAQGTMSYTVSPVHTLDLWVDMGRRIEDMGADSICIKDMAGLLTALRCVRAGHPPQEGRCHSDSHALPCHHGLVHRHPGEGRGSRHRQRGHVHLVHEHDLRPFADRVAGRHIGGQRTRHRSGYSAAGGDRRLLSRGAQKVREIRGQPARRGFAHPDRPGARWHAHQPGKSAERTKRRGSTGSKYWRKSLECARTWA